jgi:hypothetical protein
MRKKLLRTPKLEKNLGFTVFLEAQTILIHVKPLFPA